MARAALTPPSRRVRWRRVLAAGVAAFGALALAVWAAGLLPNPDPNDLARYRADDARLEAYGLRPDAVFMGDSLTDYWPTRGVASWNPRWINRGVPGQRSDQVRARFAQDVLALRPRAVVILAGTNDAWGRSGVLPLAQTEANLAAMAASARAAGIRVVLAGAPPVSPFIWPPMLGGGERRIQAMNAFTRAYAARTGAAYADYGSVMSPALTVDGLHPSARGYAAMRPVADRALAAALAAAPAH